MNRCINILFAQFYVLNVFDGSRLLSEGELVTQLEKILNNSEPQEEPVGILTTADRTVWAKQRKRLLKGTYFNLYTIIIYSIGQGSKLIFIMTSVG